MALDISTLKERAKAISGQFSTAQKIAIAGAGLAVIVAVVIFSSMAGGSTKRAALYTNLSSTDAAAITEELTKEGVSYTLADGGATVMVPQDSLYSLRLKMASKSLPAASDGYALLDKQGLTTSEFAQQVGYQRAMEGELAKTIASMDAVENATIHLVIPSNDVFATTTQTASASVMVRTHPGKQLDSGQVDAIVHLVGSSVRGLDAKKVTVTDSAGNLLAAPGMATTGAGLDGNTRQRIAFQDQLAASITALVEPIVGPGNAKVTVTADLDMNHRTTTQETFAQPSGTVGQSTPQSQTSKTETYTGADAAAAGVLGVTGTPATGGAGTNYNLDQQQTQNALNRTVETIEGAPGTVNKLGVAVAINASAASPDVVGQLRNLVTTGALINTQRGDTIEVQRVDFDTSVAEAQRKDLAATSSAHARDQLIAAGEKVGAVLLLLLALFFIWRTLHRAAQRSAELVRGTTIREIQPWTTSVADLMDPIELGPAGRPTPVRTEEDMRRESLTGEVTDMIDRQPAEVAQLLRGWLGDREIGRR